MEIVKTKLPERCQCIVKIQSELLKKGFMFLPILSDRTQHPPGPCLAAPSKVLTHEGKPSRMVFVAFNFCPFCGKQIRVKKTEVSIHD
jgi:hypothetical protein